MVATYQWAETTGTGTVDTLAITNGNWGAVDAINIDITVDANKINISGNSFSKYIYGAFTGTYSQIGPNGKLWLSAGTLPTGCYVMAITRSGFAAPTVTTTGTDLIPTTEGAALAVLYGSSHALATGTTTTAVTGYSNYYRSQLQTSANAPVGAITAQTVTHKYDEN